MEQYYNYTDELLEIIDLQQTTIKNQEIIIEKLETQIQSTKVIGVLIMVLILTKLVLRMFGIRWG